MKKILEIDVKITDFYSVKGKTGEVNMILFSGSARGEFFNGKVLGTGTDTQKITTEGKFTLSARYMLEGTDFTGTSCKLFIENNGSEEEGFKPRVITDSAALAHWEMAELKAEIEPAEGGVTVTILA